MNLESRSRRRLCGLIWIGALTISPALPDIVDVSVNGSVSGSGSVTVACALSTPGCMAVPPFGFFITVPYNFSATNTSLGSFSDSGSASGEPSFPATVSSFATQDTSATSQELDIVLTGGHSATSAPSYTASETDNISVSFELTEPSIVELAGGGFGIGPGVGELLDSNGNVILTVSSPVPEFGELGPGTYQLRAAASGGGFGAFASDVRTTDFDFSLDGSFTPIPEPRGAIFAAMFAIVLGGIALSRRRRTSKAAC